MSIGIVTDTSCDLPAATLRGAGVAAVAHRVHIGDEVYRDGRDLEAQTLFAWMAEQGVMPDTEPPPPEDFVSVYRRALEEHERLVSIHLSGRLSETLERAREAAAHLGIEERIRFVDSAGMGVTLAEMVLEAARKARFECDPERVAVAAERIRDRMAVFICPSSLLWLLHGGRLEGHDDRWSGLLRRRPLLSLRDGAVVRAGSVRRSDVFRAIAARLGRRFGDLPLRLAVGCADGDPADLARLKREAEASSLHIVHARVQSVGAAVGAHLGPGAVAVCAYPERPPPP